MLYGRLAFGYDCFVHIQQSPARRQASEQRQTGQWQNSPQRRARQQTGNRQMTNSTTATLPISICKALGTLYSDLELANGWILAANTPEYKTMLNFLGVFATDDYDDYPDRVSHDFPKEIIYTIAEAAQDLATANASKMLVWALTRLATNKSQEKGAFTLSNSKWLDSLLPVLDNLTANDEFGKEEWTHLETLQNLQNDLLNQMCLETMRVAISILCQAACGASTIGKPDFKPALKELQQASKAFAGVRKHKPVQVTAVQPPF